MNSMDTERSTLTHGIAHSNNQGLNESIVALALLQMVLAGIQPLKLFQHPVELLLATILLYACTTIKYDRWQFSLLLVLVVVTVGSYFTTNILTFLTNAKVNSLAVLSLLYFSKVRFRSKLIFPAFALSLVLLILNWFDPALVVPFANLTAFEEFTRFGGLFLNAHFNAYFMAVAVIYYGYRKRLFGLGIPVIYIPASKHVFVSYVASLVSALGPIKKLTKYRAISLAIAALGAYWIFQNRTVLIELLDTDELGSGAVILMQLFDPAYYQVLLNPFPSGNIDVSAQAIALYRIHDGYNEVGYFYLATVSGVLLATGYLYTLLRCTPYYRVFILVSLLHFGAALLSPLIVYMCVTYSREIHIRLSAVTKKRRSRLLLGFTLALREKVALKPK